MGKGEIARNEQFLLFPQCFLLNQVIVSKIFHISDIIFLFAAEFQEPKTGISGKEFTISNRLFSPFADNVFFTISKTCSIIYASTLSQISHGSYVSICSTSLLQNTVEKGEIALMSNFSVSHGVFYPFG